MRLLLLEDDIDYKESISEYLKSLDYEVDDFEDGESALNSIYEKHYHLLILDIRVPKIDGYELVKKIKKDNINIPIIFITSLTDINNLSLGYELGCNDYIKKPFSPKELKYRVEQLLKLFYTKEPDDVIILENSFKYDFLAKILYRDKEQILLTKKESLLLFTLLVYKNQFVSIETLRNEVWDDKYICEADIRGCIKKLRDKTSKDLIETKRGIGYKIVRK